MDGSVVFTEEQVPFNLEAEQALLGAILVNSKDVLPRVRDRVSAEDFYEPVHGEVYAASCALDDAGKQAEPVKLKPQFEKHEALEAVGGSAYLVRLCSSAATIINAIDYADTVSDLSKRRELLYTLDATATEANAVDTATTAESIVEGLEVRLHDIAGHTDTKRVVRQTGTVVKSALERYKQAQEQEGRIGLTSGFKTLDAVFSLNKSEFTILAGRPAMGKSALANFISLSASLGDKKQAPVGGLFFSKEMDAEDNIFRALACEISRKHQRTVPYFRMKRGALNLTEQEMMHEAAEALSLSHITWVDEAKLTPGRIRAIAKREQRRLEKQGLELGFITVDYLQQVRPDRASRGIYEDITAVSGAMLELAKEMQVPVLGLSQLSRAVEQRENKRPMLSDLRESGALEQDAANIIFAYREEYYLEKAAKDGQNISDAQTREAAGITELILAKNRNGPTDTIKVQSNMAANHFQDIGI